MHGTGQSGTRKGPDRSRVGLEYRAREKGRGGGMGGGGGAESGQGGGGGVR